MSQQQNILAAASEAIGEPVEQSVYVRAYVPDPARDQPIPLGFSQHRAVAIGIWELWKRLQLWRKLRTPNRFHLVLGDRTLAGLSLRFGSTVQVQSVLWRAFRGETVAVRTGPWTMQIHTAATGTVDIETVSYDEDARRLLTAIAGEPPQTDG